MYLKNGTKVCVLLVERNAEIHELFSELFTILGCDVVVAKDGNEALAAVDLRPAHIIFSSLILGDVNGFELCRQLRTKPFLAYTVFVALTGYTEPGIVQRARDAGFDFYILKPANLSALLNPLRQIAGLEDAALFDRYLSRI